MLGIKQLVLKKFKSEIRSSQCYWDVTIARKISTLGKQTISHVGEFHEMKESVLHIWLKI